VHKAVGRGKLFGLTPFGPFARGAEIDEISHTKLGDIRISWFCHRWHCFVGTSPRHRHLVQAASDRCKKV
jgi:hypothetical protein